MSAFAQRQVFEKVVLLLRAMDPKLINTQDAVGCTPLHCAVDKQQSTAVVGLLIKHGADVRARCTIGQTLLFYSKEAAVTRLLLEAGADVNARDYLGNTVLHDAAAQGLSAGVLCCLLKAGADATAINTICDSAAGVAAAYGCSAAAALLKRAELDQRSSTLKQEHRAPMLPAHLMLDACHRHSSSDLAARIAVFGILAKMPLFDTEPGRVELLQCTELSTATDVEGYSDLNTVQQRASAVLNTIQTQIQQRAAEAKALECGLNHPTGCTSSTKANSAQQRSGNCDTAQHLQSDCVSTSVADQHTVEFVTDAKNSDCITASGNSGGNNPALAVKREQQQQQQHHQQQSVQLQQAAPAAVALERSAAVVMTTVAKTDSEQWQQ
jgi:ankyrin repeat protein